MRYSASCLKPQDLTQCYNIKYVIVTKREKHGGGKKLIKRKGQKSHTLRNVTCFPMYQQVVDGVGTEISFPEISSQLHCCYFYVHNWKIKLLMLLFRMRL